MSQVIHPSLSCHLSWVALCASGVPLQLPSLWLGKRDCLMSEEEQRPRRVGRRDLGASRFCSLSSWRQGDRDRELGFSCSKCKGRRRENGYELTLCQRSVLELLFHLILWSRWNVVVERGEAACPRETQLVGDEQGSSSGQGGPKRAPAGLDAI